MMFGIGLVTVGLILLAWGWVGERRWQREHRRGGYIR